MNKSRGGSIVTIMTTEKTDTLPAKTSKKYYKVSDELIGMVRELVQLALLTGTNIVDHMRALVVEESDSDGRFITVSPEYVESYNAMVEKLNEEAEARIEEMQKRMAEDTSQEEQLLNLVKSDPN